MIQILGAKKKTWWDDPWRSEKSAMNPIYPQSSQTWLAGNPYFSLPIGSMYGIYANIWGILMGSMEHHIWHTWILWVVKFKLLGDQISNFEVAQYISKAVNTPDCVSVALPRARCARCARAAWGQKSARLRSRVVNNKVINGVTMI